MIKKTTLIIFLFSFAFLAQVNAQTNASVEKQTAIKELIALMDGGNSAKDFLDVMSAQMDAARRTTVTALLEERADLTPEERKSLEDLMINDMESMSKRFNEKLTQKLNYETLVNDIAGMVYDKHYNLEEIKDLILFYKSPTGQKTLKLMPLIMRETMQAMQESLFPKIPVIIKELQDEDRKELEQKINRKKPRPDKKTS